MRARLSTRGGANVAWEIKNHGDRTLRDVWVTIYFLDRECERVFEKTIQVVKGYPPLKPNYAENFPGFLFMDVPSDWAGDNEISSRHVEVVVSRFSFLEE